MQIASHQPTSLQLSSLCQLGEKILPGSAISIYELTPKSRLLQRAGPSIPKMMRPTFREIPIGREVGSCGTAAWTGRQVRVDDIASDSRWDDYRTLPLQSGFRGCWSQPIRAFNREVVGTVGFYFRNAPRSACDTSDTLRHISDVAAQVLRKVHLNEGLRANLVLTNRHIVEAVEALGFGLFSSNPSMASEDEPTIPNLQTAHLLCRLTNDSLQLRAQTRACPKSEILLSVAQELGKQARITLSVAEEAGSDQLIEDPEALRKLLFWSSVWVARCISGAAVDASITLADRSEGDRTCVELEAARGRRPASGNSDLDHLLAGMLVEMATNVGWTLSFSDRYGRRALRLSDT